MLPSDLNFGAPSWLWALLTLPALLALFVWAEVQSNRRLVRLIQTPRLRQQLAGVANAFRRRLRFALLGLGLLGLILAAAMPRWGFETRETHRRGLDLVVIADVSKSMLATDLAPDRLTREKLAVQDLIRQLQGDRVGLVAFAGTAFLQAPLTIDYDAVLDSVSELDTDLIPRGGTNLGGAIDLAMEAFGKNEAGNRAILLLSDGEATVDGEQASGVEAAKRAAAAGARLYTVGFGTPEGSLIPLGGASKGEFVRDEDGKIVRSRLDEPGLTDIARAGNGFYVRFTAGESAMHTIIEDGLSQLKAGEIDARTARRPIERYEWPLAGALVCLGLGILVGERRRRGAPASVDGISPDAIAIPTPRTRSATPAAATATAVAVLLATLPGTGPAARAAAPEKPPAAVGAPVDSPLELYRQGHYDQAYRAYEDLARKDPQADGLRFNAGASAYMGKQYDEAMEAFGKALATGDPTLRAKSHYNFGNTLFRRGEEQKEQKAKIADWRNALQHYDSTLAMLKQADPAHRNDALAGNTAYNRAIVQKRLDEELKQQPKQQQKDQDKKDQGQKDQSKSDQKNQGKQDQKDKADQQKSGGQPQQQSQDQKGSSSSQEQNGNGNQPPKPDEKPPDGQNSQRQSPPDGQPKDQQDQSKGAGKSGPDQQQKPPAADGKQSDSRNPGEKLADSPPSPNGPPDKSDLPDQDKPRQHGDFKAQPDPDKDHPPQPADAAGQEADEAAEKDGKMSPAQARALLDALKGDDARVSVDPNNKHRRDEPVTKDW